MAIEQTETFGQWLKSRRKALDVTREHLAMCASCSPATIEKIEAGRRRPSRQLAEILAQCLGIPHDQIAEFVPFARGTVAYFYPANAPQVLASSTPNSNGADNHLPQVSGQAGPEQSVEDVRKAHAEYYLRLAIEAEPEIAGPEQAEWLARLEREHDNFRASLHYFREHGEGEKLATMAVALRRFRHFHGHISEELEWLQTALQYRDELSPRLLANLLQGIGTLHWIVGDFAEAYSAYSECLATWRDLGDLKGIAGALNNLGIALTALGDYESPPALYLECLSIYRDLDEQWGIGVALSNLGLSALNRGIFAEAETYLQESLELRRARNDIQGEAQSLNNLGLVSRCTHDYTRAMALHLQSLEIFRTLGDKWSIALTQSNIGYLLLDSSDNLNEAARLFTESLTLFRELSVRSSLADCVEGLARIASARGEAEVGARLVGAAEKLREELGMSIVPYNLSGYRQSRAALVEQMGERAFHDAWLEGSNMSLERLCRYALGAFS